MRFNEILTDSIYSRAKPEHRLRQDRIYANQHIYQNKIS